MMISSRWIPSCQSKSFGLNTNIVWKLQVIDLDVGSAYSCIYCPALDDIPRHRYLGESHAVQ